MQLTTDELQSITSTTRDLPGSTVPHLQQHLITLPTTRYKHLQGLISDRATVFERILQQGLESATGCGSGDATFSGWLSWSGGSRPPAPGATDQLIEIRCTAWDLGDRPVTDRRAERRHVHLVEEVTKRGIRWRPPQLHAQRLGEHGMVANGKALQIPQALAATQDSEHGHQQQIPGREPTPRRMRASGIDLR